MSTSGRGPGYAGAVLLLGFVAVAAVVALATRPPSGPVPLDEDTPCAACGMPVRDVRFSAQLHTRSGDVLAFDDAGCLFLHVARTRPAVHATYFHDAAGAGWLRPEQAGFVPAATPMGYGYAAVPKGHGETIPLDEAIRRVVEEARDQPGH